MVEICEKTIKIDKYIFIDKQKQKRIQKKDEVYSRKADV